MPFLSRSVTEQLSLLLATGAKFTALLVQKQGTQIKEGWVYTLEL
jgi:hypothetical protein